MDSTILTILIAVTAGLVIWGAVQLVFHFTRSEKRQLQKRLEIRAGTTDPLATGRSSILQAEAAPLPSLLRGMRLMERLNKRLLGAFPDAKLSTFLSIMLAMAGIAFAVVGFTMDSLAAGGIAAAVAGYLPVMYLNGRRARRQRALVLQLPEALEFLCRVLRAGHSLSTGLQMMGEELPNPLAAEFRKCYAQHSLGQPLDEAMREMTRHIDSTDFAFFVTAVLIQRQTGGDLSEVLSNISGMVRERIRLQQHVKAITAEGRITSYILVAFPVVLFAVSYTLNPAYTGLLIRTDTGRLLLMVAVGLVAFGMWVIRKIVSVKV